MGERASFVTEYINCEHCFHVAERAFASQGKRVTSLIIPNWRDETDPIIAGRISTTTIDGEWSLMQEIINENMVNLLCHNLRIALIGEDRQGIITVYPNKWATIVPDWCNEDDN